MLSNKELNELKDLQNKLFMAVFLSKLNSGQCNIIIKSINKLIKELHNAE